MPGEFANDDEIERVAGSKLNAFKQSVEDIADYADLYQRKGATIPEAQFNLIVEALKDSLNNAESVIRLLSTANGLPDSYINDFIRYARKRISEAIRFINDDKTPKPGENREVKIGPLRLQTYAEEYLDLLSKIFQEEREASPDFTKLRRNFANLTNHPAAKEVHGLEAMARDLPSRVSHLDIRVQEPFGANEATLTTSEADGLAELLENDGKDSLWIKNNPSALRKILEDVSDYDGSPRGFSYIEGPLELRSSLENLLKEYDRIEKIRSVNPSVPNDTLSKYGLTKSRADQIMDALSKILDITSAPEYIAWATQLKNKIIWESDPQGVSYEDLIARIEAKIVAKQPITPEEKRDLNELVRHLETQRGNVRSIRYVGDENFNNNLWAAEEATVDQEIRRIQDLRARGEGIGGSGRRTGAEARAGKESEELKMVQAMYSFLKEQRNEFLPEWDDVVEGRIGMTPPEFMREVTIALAGQLGYLVDATAASAKTPITLPSSHANMWEQFEIGQRNIQAGIPDTIKPTFKFFFENFPWEAVTPGLFDDSRVRDQFNFLWKMRIVHFNQMHNFAADIRTLLDAVDKRKDSEEFPVQLYQEIAKHGADGGLYPPDMEPYFTNDHSSSDPKEQKLAELLGTKEIGWLMPEYSQFFLSFINRELGDYNPEDPKDVAKFRVLKTRAKAAIPEHLRAPKNPKTGEFRDDAILERAWEEAIWRYHITLDIFRHDPGANFTKMPRATELADYGVKTQPGLSNTGSLWRPTVVESIERAIVYPSDFIYQYAELPQTHYEPWSAARLKSEVKALKSIITEQDEEDQTPLYREYLAFRNLYVDLLRKSEGNDADIKDHYVIIKIRPEHCSLGIEGLPVAIPKAMIDHSRNKFDAQYHDYIPLTEKQVMESMIDRNLIDFSTLTPNHRVTWGTATKDTIVWYQLLDLKKPDAVFTPAHDPRLTAKLKRLQQVFPIKEAILKINARFDILTNGRIFGRHYAKHLDHHLRHEVYVDKMGSDELAKLFDLSKFTQTTGRYGFAGEMTQNMAVIEGQPLAPSPELWVSTMHDEWSGGEHGNEIKDRKGNPIVGKRADGKRVSRFKTFTEFVRTTQNASEARRMKKTKVRRNVREAAKLLATDDKRARNQIIAESLVIAFGAYLDQYRYESHDAGFNIKNVMNLKVAHSRIRTIGSVGKETIPPLDFAHRELVLNIIVKQMGLLQTSGEYPGGLIQNYDKEYFIKMMEDRGLIGTQEQAIVDLYYLMNDYEKISADASGKEEKH